MHAGEMDQSLKLSVIIRSEDFEHDVVGHTTATAVDSAQEPAV
jgi:hypothetical protein